MPKTQINKMHDSDETITVVYSGDKKFKNAAYDLASDSVTIEYEDAEEIATKAIGDPSTYTVKETVMVKVMVTESECPGLMELSELQIKELLVKLASKKQTSIKNKRGIWNVEHLIKGTGYYQGSVSFVSEKN